MGVLLEGLRGVPLKNTLTPKCTIIKRQSKCDGGGRSSFSSNSSNSSNSGKRKRRRWRWDCLLSQIKEELHVEGGGDNPGGDPGPAPPNKKIGSGSISGYKMTLISQGRCWRGVGDGSMLQ